tara:strand:+ start:154 stop:348 length:195 start_codon:yes stop_codon:yes gene_type:complete
MKSTGESSQKFGDCQVCRKPASEVFYMTQMREYFNQLKKEFGVTQHDCFSKFGHKSCLSGLTNS